MVGSFGGVGGKLPFFLFAAAFSLRLMKSKRRRGGEAIEGKEGNTLDFKELRKRLLDQVDIYDSKKEKKNKT